MLMTARESCLLFTDRPKQPTPSGSHKKVALLLAAARELDVPVLPEDGDAPGSALSVEEAAAAFEALGRRQAVLADMAPGSPIAQIAAKLLEDGFEVFVVADLAAAPGSAAASDADSRATMR